MAMEEAVAGERFADAARLRAELGELEERDSLSRVLRARRRRLCKHQHCSFEQGLRRRALGGAPCLHPGSACRQEVDVLTVRSGGVLCWLLTLGSLAPWLHRAAPPVSTS